jgi:hypothetical protein
MADTWHIDYSAAHLDGRTILQTRVGPKGEYASGAIRYIDDITNPRLVRTKHITKPEYTSLKSAGVALDAMYLEVGVDDPLGGYGQGQAYARRAQAGVNYLGWRGKVLFCCDRWFNVSGRTPISVRVWQDYLDGAVSVLGRSIAGSYGFADAIDAARGHVDFAVQAGSRSAVRSWVNGWQDNNSQPKVGGISTDRVLILKPFNPPGGGGTQPSKEAIMKMAVPQSLPKSAEWQQLVFPVEVGSNSTVIAAMWLTLVSACDADGTTEYEVWIGNDAGEMTGGTGGSDPVTGTLRNNGHAVIGLPSGTRIVTLKYRNTGYAQAGYSFPQVGQ